MSTEISQELEIAVRKQTRIKDAAMLNEMAGHRVCTCGQSGPIHEYGCPRGAILDCARSLALLAED
jgi:hypothetical protein